MSDKITIEVWGRTIGFVEKDGALFRFHALTTDFQGLQGMTFAAPGYARIAAARQLTRPRSEQRIQITTAKAFALTSSNRLVKANDATTVDKWIVEPEM